MYCYNCGKQIPEHSTHCPLCGNKIAILQAIPATVINDPESKKTSTGLRTRRDLVTNQNNIDKGWWLTTPGVLTIIALLAAVAGLIVMLYPGVKHVQPSAPNEGWVIVLSGNIDLDNAKSVVKKAASLDYQALIYQRERLYRPVIGPFRTKDNAMSILEKIRINIEPDAYVEELKTWCPNSRVNGDIYSCQ
jgi:hypothetical protein